MSHDTTANLLSGFVRGNSQLSSMPLSQTMTAETGKKSGKRTYSDTEDDPTPEDLSKMSRSERKRHREKKRRNDVNKGFDELFSLLLEIDPDVRTEASERAGPSADDSGLSRVDLIAHAIKALRRVHSENEERKLLVARLVERRAAAATTSSAQDCSSLDAIRLLGRDVLGNRDAIIAQLLAGQNLHTHEILPSGDIMRNLTLSSSGLNVPNVFASLPSRNNETVRLNLPSMSGNDSTRHSLLLSLLAGGNPVLPSSSSAAPSSTQLSRHYFQLLRDQESAHLLSNQMRNPHR